MKREQQFIDIAIKELLNPELEATKQYLEVCELEYEEGQPKVSRVAINLEEQSADVYFAVKTARYYIVVHLTTDPEIKAYSVWVESGHLVYLTAVSNKLTFDELASFIRLAPLEGWSIGERKNFKNSANDFSRINYDPIKNEAYDLEEKLNLLLDELEKDIDGVVELTKNAYAYISVCKYQYIDANAGISLDIQTISRLNKLNLGLDIDTYIVGNRVKE
ncbi:MAG: DUF4279 domain-containing protein [Saprospiraceae bacterium]|nr:DUF4279 domain-containing protein [Saprospiraceae bacterium]